MGRWGRNGPEALLSLRKARDGFITDIFERDAFPARFLETTSLLRRPGSRRPLRLRQKLCRLDKSEPDELLDDWMVSAPAA